jgi:hypothetical protein
MAERHPFSDKAKTILKTGLLGAAMLTGTGEAAMSDSDLNAQVLADAERNRVQILKESENNYSRDLQAIEKRFSTDSPNPAEKQTVVMIDPLKVVAGQALGMTPEEAFKQSIPDGAFGKGASPTTVNEVNKIIDGEALDSKVRANAMTIAGSRFCFVVPTSERSPVQVDGLSQHEKTAVINSHEAGHCLDDSIEGQLKAQKELRDKTLDAETRAEKQDALTIEIQKREAFADNFTAGDMVRTGSPLSIIDKMIARRADPSESESHNTSAPLAALKGKIEEMGIDKFKSLNNRELQDLYHSLDEDNALTPEKIKDLKSAAVPASLDGAAQPVSLDTLNKWDYKSELQKKAVVAGGEVSPKTLLNAYGQTQDGLRQEIQANPESEALATAKMSVLANNIGDVVRGTDYAAANKAHGVDLKNAPSFSKFMQPDIKHGNTPEAEQGVSDNVPPPAARVATAAKMKLGI